MGIRLVSDFRPVRRADAGRGGKAGAEPVCGTGGASASIMSSSSSPAKVAVGRSVFDGVSVSWPSVLDTSRFGMVSAALDLRGFFRVTLLRFFREADSVVDALALDCITTMAANG
jgi:hypothetical protein